MSGVKRKKKKAKSRDVELESSPIIESEPETNEPDTIIEIDTIESILDDLESSRDTLPESVSPDLQDIQTKEISKQIIQPTKPTRRKDPYRFPEFPKSVDVESQIRRTQKPIESTKIHAKTVTTKSKLQVKGRTKLSKKDRERILGHEGDVYASVATLNFLTLEFTEHGTVPPDKYRRFLRSLLNNIEKAKHELEQLGIVFSDFLEHEELIQQFPKGIEILEKHLHGILIVPSRDLTQLPRKSAKFVGTCIELIDLLRLGELARVELLLPLLDDLARVLESISFIGDDYWSVKIIREWIKTLELESPETILNENLARMLELQADRWLRDFKNQLDNLG